MQTAHHTDPKGPVPSADLIGKLPKTDVHVHLDGSLRLDTLIELARDARLELPSQTPEGLLELVFKETYDDLEDYLRAFSYTSPALCTAEALERTAYELGADNLAEGVCYVEVRLAPQLHTGPDLDTAGVLAAVDRGLNRVRQEHEATDGVKSGAQPPFRYGIIACALRMFGPGHSPYYRGLYSALQGFTQPDVHAAASLSLARAVVEARDRLGLPIVAFDLAGAEAGNPASLHRDAYLFAQQNFLMKTVHAGEAYGPESIYQAITLLGADRIGHGTHLYDVDRLRRDNPNSTAAKDPERYIRNLTQYISDRRITLEVCITSNLQSIQNLRKFADHPFGRMVADRLSVTLCTDNRLMSRTTVTKEIASACKAFNLSQDDLRNVIIYGFKRSFYPGSYLEKRAYVRRVIDYYDDVMRAESSAAGA